MKQIKSDKMDLTDAAPLQTVDINCIENNVSNLANEGSKFLIFKHFKQIKII